jgi:hypothetical protein
MIKASFFVLYLITIPNVLVDSETVVHRLAFNEQKSCLYMAHTLKQELDPFAQKQQCQENTEWYEEFRMPLRKPDFMD